MAQDVIVRGVTYTGVEKLSLPISGGSATFRDTSDADAAAGDVLSGKKAYGSSGALNGSMTNRGAVSGTISDINTPYQIPQGYHNGSGSVDIASAQKALLIPGNIRDSVTILGVTGDYTGGGGGPTSSDAILLVTVPSGSTVTATKGGTTLTPTMWTAAADANSETALFVISSFDSTAWTATATKGTDTATATVTIDSAKSYEMSLDYGTWFVRDGIVQSGFSFATNQAAVTFTDNYEGLGFCRIQRAKPSGGTTYYVLCSPAHNFGAKPYSTLYFDFQVIDIYSNSGAATKIGFGTSTITEAATSWPVAQSYVTGAGAAARQTISVDVSSLADSEYLKLTAGASSARALDMRIYNLWLE